MAFMSGTDEGRMMTTKEFSYLVESRLYFKYSIYQKGVRASGKVREGCRDVVKELGRYLHYIFVTHVQDHSTAFLCDPSLSDFICTVSVGYIEAFDCQGLKTKDF